MWVLVKNYPGELLRRHWQAVLRAQLRITWAALKAWRGQAARGRLRGQLAALLGLPGWLRKRRNVQAGRRVSPEAIERLLLR